MTVWRYQAALGEERAALVDDDGTIVEALIEPDTPRLRLGGIHTGRAVRLEAGRYAIVDIDGHEAIVEPRPRGWTEGASVGVEITREALAESGRTKRARARPAPDLPLRAAPTLLERIEANGLSIESCARGADVFVEDDDCDVRDEAINGHVRFDVGELHVEATRAMTTIDIDGWGDLDTLVVRAAAIAALTIRRLGIGGSIGIDFPSVDKAARAAASTAFDAGLPLPFERTAINGFGLMQVVRPRRRPSLIELFRDDAVGCAARLTLDRVAEGVPIGSATIVAAPAVVDWLAARPDLLDRLGRMQGGAITLRAQPALPIWSSYAET